MSTETNYIRLRGLPFAAKESDVRNFLEGITAKSVTFTLRPSGRASGECYVELNEANDVKEALKLDRREMSGRYIEVFTVGEAELSMMMRHGVLKGGDQGESRYVSNFVVRLRGLPYSANADDIKEFFKGLEVSDVVIDKEPGGRPSGEAFVRFSTKEHAELALERSKNNMGSRYVEVFRSSGEEMDNCYYTSRGIPPPMGGPIPLRGLAATYDPRYGYSSRYGGPIRGAMYYQRPSPYERRYDRYAASYEPEYDEFEFDAAAKVFMRGLPYNVTALDIEEFFKPLNCVEIKLGYNEDRRLSGDGVVLFSTMAEARDALSRNKNNIGTRYIELFSGTNVPYPTRYTTFRLIGGSGASSAARSQYGRYSSFADDDDYSGYGVGGQQYYNDQYECRQSKFGREWGEPGRTLW